MHMMFRQFDCLKETVRGQYFYIIDAPCNMFIYIIRNKYYGVVAVLGIFCSR